MTPARPTSSATTGAIGSRRRSSRPPTARRTTTSAARSPSPATRPWSGPTRDDDNGVDSGSAYVFRYDGSDWVEEAKLTASDGAADDYFGGSVAISGDTAVVGAVCDDDNGRNSGSAYVFRYDGSDWAEEAKLTASDGAAYDYFGCSVAVSGDTAVVGASDDDDNGLDSGSAYVFRYDGSDWTEEAKLTASDGAAERLLRQLGRRLRRHGRGRGR